MTMAREYDIESAFAAIEDELIDSMMRNMKRHRVEEVAEDKQWEMWQSLQLKHGLPFILLRHIRR